MTESPEAPLSVQELPLAADFAEPTQAQWEKEVLKVLNKGRPEGKELSVEQGMERLRTKTVDGLTIEPLYTRENAPEKLGYPGVAPFTRGTTIRTGNPDAWDVRQLHEDPDPQVTNAAILTDLERGATSTWVRIDADAVKASDLARVTEGMLLDLAGIYVSSRDDQDAAATAMAELIRNCGKDANAVKGNFGLDALGFAALHGTAVDCTAQRAWVATARKEFKNIRAITIDVLAYNAAGATDTDEVAFALATGVAYLRDLVAAGLTPAEAAQQIEFRVSANQQQFLTIARLRAFRATWARVCEAAGVPAEDRGAIQHAVSSLRMFTRDDPYVNMLRTTVATFAASVGGAEAITTLPFDNVNGLPSDFSRRIARNTQIILAEESNIGRVNDPAGGAWVIETLTNDIATTAWKRFQEIEAAGGMAAALASGKIQAMIDEANVTRAGLLATRKIPVTGVSMFPMRDEKAVEAKARPQAPAYKIVTHRDSEVFEALRDRVAAKPAAVELACIGTRRDFGGRQQFVENLLLVAGLSTPMVEAAEVADFAKTEAKVAILCSSAKVYADKALDVARTLKENGVEKVFLAGNIKELGDADPAGLIDGTVFDGMNVVEFLDSLLNTLEA
ncbi:MAG: methylmalonyl-CoA mutase small subunit [Propionibacteriaceae bacterium]